MNETKKEYSNGEVTIVWKPKTCIHAANCVKGLPGVFNPNEKPWIKVGEASTQELIDQVKKCPSGALSYYLNDEKQEPEAAPTGTKVEAMQNGPLLVHGSLEVTRPDGTKDKKNKTTAFCRCGASSNKPYCDGSHSKINFKG